MVYTLVIQGTERVWSYQDKEIHRKNFKDNIFDLLDCQLCWIYLANTITDKYVMINDLSLPDRGTRRTYMSDIHDQQRKIPLYFSNLSDVFARNILTTRLPRHFYLSKHCFERDWAGTRIAYSYKDIFKFLDYSDFKLKLSSVDTVIWGNPNPDKIINGLPNYKIDDYFYGEIDTGLHFTEINAIFFPFYKGREEFVSSLTLGIGR